MKLKRQPRTLLEVCVAKRGTRRGAVAAANFIAWVMQTAELGRVPTVVEYSDYWGMNERTGWHHAESIAAVFGADWRQLVEQMGRQLAAQLRKGVDRPSPGTLRSSLVLPASWARAAA